MKLTESARLALLGEIAYSDNRNKNNDSTAEWTLRDLGIARSTVRSAAGGGNVSLKTLAKIAEILKKQPGEIAETPENPAERA